MTFTKKLAKTSTYSIPISIPTYHISIFTYQHITYHIPRTTYPCTHIPTYQHITYHISHTHIPTYHISHMHIPSYQHTTHNIPHTAFPITTFHIPKYHIPTYHHVLHSILSLLFMDFFYCPNFCVYQYSIILPKNTIIKIQKYFVKLKSLN
jgi:hypothetical protein